MAVPYIPELVALMAPDDYEIIFELMGTLPFDPTVVFKLYWLLMTLMPFGPARF